MFARTELKPYTPEADARSARPSRLRKKARGRSPWSNPDLDAALRDAARILKPGGALLATFPFANGEEATLVRAVAEDGGIRFLAPPEYHSNPTDPEHGSLVFQIPAWDIVERAKAAGFRDAIISYVSSRRKGFTGSNIAGIFLFEATK